MSRDNPKLLARVMSEIYSVLQDRDAVFSLLISDRARKFFLFPQVFKSINSLAFFFHQNFTKSTSTCSSVSWYGILKRGLTVCMLCTRSNHRLLPIICQPGNVEATSYSTQSPNLMMSPRRISLIDWLPFHLMTKISKPWSSKAAALQTRYFLEMNSFYQVYLVYLYLYLQRVPSL